MHLREQTALAFGIAELATGVEHLEAAYPGQTGQLRRLRAERDYLVRRWPDQDQTPEEIVQRAREFCAVHHDVLDQLLHKRERER